MPFANTAPGSKPIPETRVPSRPCSVSPAARLDNPSIMDEAQRRLKTDEIERQLVVALCSPAPDHKTRGEILHRLAAHTFANPDHKPIFPGLSKIPRATT